MQRFCDGVRRRDFLRVGTASLLGLNWTLPRVLQAQQAAQRSGRSPRDVALILLYLKGGLSTIDSWDLKPNAPAEFRGDFHPIATNVPGIQIGEHLPCLARQ